MATVKPITPDDMPAAKQTFLPDEVLTTFNELITKYWDGSSATVPQEELIQTLSSRMNCSHETVFANHWLDVEEVYQAAGWSVVYDRPAFYETPFPATFIFRRPRT